MFAGERAAPLRAARRYGKRLETRPIFTRTVCHSHTRHGPCLSMTAVLRCSTTNRRGRSADSRDGYRGNVSNNPREFLRRGTASALLQGRSHLGLDPECTVGAAARLREAVMKTSLLLFLRHARTHTHRHTNSKNPHIVSLRNICKNPLIYTDSA